MIELKTKTNQSNVRLHGHETGESEVYIMKVFSCPCGHSGDDCDGLAMVRSLGSDGSDENINDIHILFNHPGPRIEN